MSHSNAHDWNAFAARNTIIARQRMNMMNTEENRDFPESDELTGKELHFYGPGEGSSDEHERWKENVTAYNSDKHSLAEQPHRRHGPLQLLRDVHWRVWDLQEAEAKQVPLDGNQSLGSDPTNPKPKLQYSTAAGSYHAKESMAPISAQARRKLIRHWRRVDSDHGNMVTIESNRELPERTRYATPPENSLAEQVGGLSLYPQPSQHHTQPSSLTEQVRESSLRSQPTNYVRKHKKNHANERARARRAIKQLEDGVPESKVELNSRARRLLKRIEEQRGRED